MESSSLSFLLRQIRTSFLSPVLPHENKNHSSVRHSISSLIGYTCHSISYGLHCNWITRVRSRCSTGKSTPLVSRVLRASTYLSAPNSCSFRRHALTAPSKPRRDILAYLHGVRGCCRVRDFLENPIDTLLPLWRGDEDVFTEEWFRCTLGRLWIVFLCSFLSVVARVLREEERMKEERLVRVSLTFRTTFDGSENLFGRFVLVHGELFQVEDKTKNRKKFEIRDEREGGNSRATCVISSPPLLHYPFYRTSLWRGISVILAVLLRSYRRTSLPRDQIMRETRCRYSPWLGRSRSIVILQIQPVRTTVWRRRFASRPTRIESMPFATRTQPKSTNR